MTDEFGGVEVEERPQTVDEFGGVSVEEEAPVQIPEFPKLAEGATFAQAIRQPTPVGVLPPTSIVPAIKLIGGEIVPGQLGDTHPDIIRREGLEAEDIDKRLFQTPFGPLDRDQAAIATGLRTDFERGQLHSTDLKRALAIRPPDTDLASFQAPEGVQRQLEEAATGEAPKPLITLPEIPESLKQAYSMPVRALFGDKAADLEVAIADELYNAAKSVPEFLTTEEGMLSILASANPVGRLGVIGYFTQDMARSVIDQAKRMGEDWDSLSTEGKARRLTQAASTLGFTAALGKAAFGEGLRLVRPTPRVTPPQQAPPVIPPESRPTVPAERAPAPAPSPAPAPKPTPAVPAEGFVQVGGLTQSKVWNWLNKRYGIKQGGKVVMEDFGPGTENVPADTRYSTKLDAEGKPMVDEAGVPVPDKPTRIRINTRAAHTPKTLERYVAEEFGHWYDIENRARSEEIIEGLTPEESANLRATVTKRYEPGVRGFEMRAQGIELLARSWRDRPWFEKFVLEVKNFLSDKLGVRVTDKVMRARAEKVAVRAIMQAAERVRAASREMIRPKEDTIIGQNAAGETLYERKNGSRYRMRFDRKDKPYGYPDFGGDLAPAETAERAVAPAPVAPVLKSPSEKSTQSIRSFSDEQWDVLTEELIDATDVYATGGSAREGGRRAYELEDRVIAFMESARKEHADKSLSEAFGEFRKSGQASDADLRKIRKILVDSGFMKPGKVSRAPKAPEPAAPAPSAPAAVEATKSTAEPTVPKPTESTPPAEGALEARMAREEKPPAGYVRLYRGTKAEGIESPWFTENPERARSFGQFISYVDVPREVAARYRGLIKTDYVLPDELIRQEKHIASPIPQRVWEVESSFQSRIPETIPGDRVVTIEKTDPDGKVSRYVGSWNPEKSYDLRELPQYGRLIPQIGKVTPTGWSHGLLGENERIIDDGGKSAIEEGSFQAKVTPGMGASQAGEKPKAAQIEQLTQALEGVRASKAPIGQQVKQSFSIGERFATARDAIGRAVAGMKTSGDTLISKWKGTENIDDMLRAKGELSKEIEARGWRLRQWERMAKKAIPNPKDQAAIAKWVDAGGDMSVLQEGLRNAPAQYKQAYADALKLSGDKLVAAQNVQNYFDARLQEAIDAGVLEHGVENYIHRMYESRPDLQKKALAYTQGGLLKTNPSMAKKRVFQFDWEAEKAGYRPVQSFIKRITAYEASLTKAIAAREFIKKTTGMKAKDGRPVVDIKGVGIPIEDPAGVYREATLITPKYSSAKSNEPTLPSGADNPNYRGDYVHRDYRALSRWKWVSSDADGKPIFVQGDVAIHPDYVGRIDALLQPSQVRFGKYGKILRPAMQVSSVAKQTMLDLSGFHQVQITVHGMEHKVMPWRIIREIDLSSPDVDGLLKGGLTLGGDYSGAYREGLVGSSLTRLIPGLGNLIESYHQWLFQDYIPRIKTTMALHALERNRSRFSGKMSDEAIFRKTANQANAAFGELNYTMLERSKTAQDISRLILLAPDFLEARGRFAAQAFERGGRGVPLIGGNEQRMALLLGALTMYVTARIANKIIDNQYHEEPENLFNIVYNGHAYGLRTVQGDLLHLLNKPLQFWTSRLNPVYGRTLLEALTGRDYFGRKRSVAEQAWDAASTIVPISLRSSRERSLWESLLNGFGVTARRWSDVDDAFKLSAKWKEQHGVGERGEFIYDPNKDPLRPLKLALNHGDEAGAAKEIKALLDSKAYTIKRLDQYFKRYASMPFAGSKANDKKFIATLTDDQRKTVEAARQHKIELARLYRKSRGQYLAPAVSDTTATPATDEFGGIPLE